MVMCCKISDISSDMIGCFNILLCSKGFFIRKTQIYLAFQVLHRIFATNPFVMTLNIK